MKFFKSNTNTHTMVGPIMDATTGIVPRVTLTASCVEGIVFWETDAGSAGTQIAFSCTASADQAYALVTTTMGFYDLDILATALNTRGRVTIALRISSTNAAYCVPVWHEGMVLPGDYFDTLFSTTAGTAYKKFYDVTSPTGTINSLPDAVPGAANALLRAGTNYAVTVSALTITTALVVGTTCTIGTVNTGPFTVTSLNATGMVVTTALTVGALVATSMSVGIFGVTGAMNIGTTMSAAVISTPMFAPTSMSATTILAQGLMLTTVSIAGSANFTGIALTTAMSMANLVITATASIGKVATSIATFTGITITTGITAGACVITTMSVGMFAATTAFSVGALSVLNTMSVAGSANFTGLAVTTAMSMANLNITATASMAKFFAADATFTGVTVTTALTVGGLNATTMSISGSANFVGVAVTTAFKVGGFIATTVSIAGTIAVDGTAIFKGIDATAVGIGDLTVTSTASIAKFNIGGFVDVIDRSFQILNNKMSIYTSSGATTLRNFADDADLATTTVTDAAGVTERDHLTWI